MQLNLNYARTHKTCAVARAFLIIKYNSVILPRFEMDFKAVSRDPKKYVRQTSRDFHPVHQNFDPDLHPFQEQREYVRALNAVKLDRVFAKPFIASLDGHKGTYFL